MRTGGSEDRSFCGVLACGCTPLRTRRTGSILVPFTVLLLLHRMPSPAERMTATGSQIGDGYVSKTSTHSPNRLKWS